jgi:hypothetical protein
LGHLAAGRETKNPFRIVEKPLRTGGLENRRKQEYINESYSVSQNMSELCPVASIIICNSAFPENELRKGIVITVIQIDNFQ